MLFRSHSPALIALFLDPRYKKLRLLKDRPDDRQKFVEYVQELIPDPVSDHHDDIKQEDAVESSEARVSILDCLKGDVEIDLTKPADKSQHLEIQSYISAPVYTLDPLEWWKQNDQRYPGLAKLAKEYLCIPATEVASERIFSAAGLTLTKLRSQLDPGTVDATLLPRGVAL